ncbi:GNAT family N-acetyltransferase [Metabacillus arenae]|uniref:GNAT family N-acetyltransferase n=1 Tax=Metabacillus arenae TaxID=2771434 RepID=A0A926ND92_9BACI|nr:GNAT family protein [Metabacillus arenae]MBD1378720.1 GNAT family N-acetyltransferase [Metabacillus arenae]
MEIQQIFKELPILETDRLLLRKLRREDAEDIFQYASKEEVARNVTWDAHLTLSDTEEYLDFAFAQYEGSSVAPWGIELKETNSLIGTIDFVNWHPKHKKAEIGYVLSPFYWNKGLTTEAANKIIEYGFINMDLIRIQARCFSTNKASEKVMKKIGMMFEGVERQALYTKGQHRDVMVYSILREEYERNEKRKRL